MVASRVGGKRPHAPESQVATIASWDLDWLEYDFPTAAWAERYGGRFIDVMNLLSGHARKPRSNKIFVSYSSRDEGAALEIVAQLEQFGLRCWISQRDVPLGESHQQAIVDALGAATVMLLVFSRHVNERPDEVLKESSVANKHGVIIVPVRIDDTEPTGAFEYELATRQRIDLYDDREQSMRRLLESLGDLVRRQS